MHLDLSAFGSAGLGGRIRMVNQAFGVRLWSAQLAAVWGDAIHRLKTAGAVDPRLVRELRREMIALAPDSDAAEDAYRALMNDDTRPTPPPTTGIVHLILSCRKYEAKALELHRRIAEHLHPVFILVGDETLEAAEFDGPFIVVPAPDNYENLTWKIMEGLLAVRQRFGNCGVLKIDDDSEIRGRPQSSAVAQLIGSAQYAGRVVGGPDFDRCWHVGKCQNHSEEPYRRRYNGGFVGGPLYYLGPVAVDRLVREYLFSRDEFAGEIFEDKAVGDALRRHGIMPVQQDLSAIFGIYNEINAPPPLPSPTVEVGCAARDKPQGEDASEREAGLSPAKCTHAQGGAAELRYWASRHEYWESFFASEDPWQYDNAYEVTKYEQTLALLPSGPIATALEVACAEGHFTARLAPRVDSLIASDISATAIARAGARCSGFPNVQVQVLDFASDELPPGLDLIVCSEALYYLPRDHLPKVAQRFAAALNPGGHLLTAHPCLVTDDRDRTGFDWGHSFGVRTISEVFSASPDLCLVKELCTELYRIQLFRCVRGQPDRARVEPERIEATHGTPLPVHVESSLIWGGAVLTRAEAEAEELASEIPILMYHSVSDAGPPELEPYRVSPTNFRTQMRSLRRHGYRAITIEEWAAAMAGGTPLPGRPVVITFDDGYRNFIEQAAPILEATDFRATVFVVTDKVGGVADWDTTSAVPLPLMDWDDLRDLQRRGFEIGSHTTCHADLCTLSDDEIVRDSIAARVALQKQLGRNPTSIALPWGRGDSRVVAALRRGGFRTGVSTINARSRLDDDLMSLPRIEVFGQDDLETFRGRLQTPSLPGRPRRMEKSRDQSASESRPLTWPVQRLPKAGSDMTPALLRLYAGRLDTLIGSLVALQSDLLAAAAPPESAQQRLTSLFNVATTDDTSQHVEAYRPISPGVHFGFDATASVTLLVRPKRGPAMSPESCLNTLEIAFTGTSRWLTLEVACSWAEIAEASRYQLNVCGEPDHPIACRPLLRLPQQDGSRQDCTLSPLTLAPGRHSGVASGELVLSDLATADTSQPPAILFFFDCTRDLRLELDYINLYFA